MSVRPDTKFVLVSRKTRLQELIERFNTWPQASFYLEHNDADPADYLAEHDLYQAQLLEAEKELKAIGRFQGIDRKFLPNYQFGTADIVVTIGQDGLVANTLKYLNGQPVIAVNPDPERWDGKLLPFGMGELPGIAGRASLGEFDARTITLAEAQTNDGQRLLAVNDLFIGPRSHTSARYLLSWNGAREEQSSSGVIVSTGFGSTGWFQSLLAGAQGIAGSARHELADGFAWEEERLQFTVREPFPSQTTGTNLVFGAIKVRNSFCIESLMPENGVVFSDGIENDYLAFNSGTTLKINVAPEKGALVMP
jgi:NAD kinase